ncbi:XdhC family protein [Texcoconibacillus texcoconensis]|uniref:Xanthine dehydrogenase accessory factor n=1 Tax=Texcoconibacillus texcoconensis TaxID=1095777 RepID=A0A840QLN5_9BACI|nr:XdhC family protein [Texcoconibacillus texcoconensis]MBB5172285.1 xanthine dehydrogenase accessory factor [Texcoconibacillus texcoconensis]
MDDMYSILEVLEVSELKSVLATVIHVEGSAYKKEGSLMLFQETGRQIGMISAGCLEEDLSYHANEVLHDGQSKTIKYDLREESDFMWGQGAGCNGVIYILLQPVDEKRKQELLLLKRHVEEGKSVLHTKRLTKAFHLIDEQFYVKKGQSFKTAEQAFPVCEHEGLFSQPTQMRICEDTETCIYTHTYQPKPRLVLFGAGLDAIPFVTLAANTGFSVTVCDWRPGICTKERFPEAEDCIIAFPKEISERVDIRKEDFVVIMTHNFLQDREILKQISHVPVRYLGILGAKKRTEKLLEGIEVQTDVHTPVGLNIGARGETEIAISIVAELIQVVRHGVKEEVGVR